jgi:ribosomal protein L16 Arg81 hydroxylase
MLESDPADLIRAMTLAGIKDEEAVREVNLAIRSPYILGSERLRNRLAKRDWLFATYRKLNRLSPNSAQVERRFKLSRADFLNHYYSIGRPVIITGMMEDWPAMRKWNLEFFADHFAKCEVEVQMGRESDARYETESERFVQKILFGEFIEKLRKAGKTNDFYLTANNNSSNKRALLELWQDIVQIPEYLTPIPEAGFIWMGPAGTVTPFHHDLTNNFMAQVIGRKRVKLAPSWDTPLMRNEHHVFSKIDGGPIQPSTSPTLQEPQFLELILEPGEILFLPVGCWHYVEGLDITVTMQFTNFVFDNDFSSFYHTYRDV